MKDIRCIDCVHCVDKYIDDDVIREWIYFCDAGSVMININDPEKLHDCADFEQFIEDI